MILRWWSIVETLAFHIMKKTAPHQDPILLRTRQVCEQLNVSRTFLNALVRDGKIPAPVQLGPRAIAFKAADIAAFIAALSPIR